jgi:hypothetical protein
VRRLARAGQYTSQARERRGAVTRFVEPAWSDVQSASPICVLSIQLVSTSNYGGAAGLVSAISPLRHVQMKHRGGAGEITGEDQSRGLMLSANAPPSCPGCHTGLFVALAWLAGYSVGYFLGLSCALFDHLARPQTGPAGLDLPLAADPDFEFEPWICRRGEPVTRDFRGISW